MIPSIPYTRPSITDLEVQYAADAARTGWGPQCYDYINRFENTFKDHLSVQFAIATSSCTGALHLGLASLGITKDDEVILADTNWIATVAPVVHLGARPVFVDIRPDTWCLDPKQVKAALSPRTKAIIAVHLYGNLCEMEELLALGESYGVPVIEDAAEALGSVYHGKRAGSMGKFAAFSFHGSKTVTTGEGGMLVTNDAALYEQALTLSHHGRSRKQTKQFWPEVVGFKYRLSNIQAALGCAQMERIDALLSRKREILKYYREQLERPGISMNPEPKGTVNGAWMPTIVFDRRTGVTTDELLLAFRAARIDARVFFHPLSSLPMFEARASNRNAYDIAQRALNLPSFHDMTRDHQDRVISIVLQALEKKSAQA